ncbi:hypothetical protein M9H77_28962 [Catharanthus roseus]|uniref:Uncharacterized protein n=1 Tax=Catharanthus roseus TaxID=4058 RepID=A0ACC0AHT1_CATRO|nr:hypothetical protein M9H77_28962 [Catharanthus roseus]
MATRFSNSSGTRSFQQQSTRRRQRNSNFRPRNQQSQSHGHNHHLNYGVIMEDYLRGAPFLIPDHHHYYNVAAAVRRGGRNNFLRYQRQFPYYPNPQLPHGNYYNRELFSRQENRGDVRIPVPRNRTYSYHYNQYNFRQTVTQIDDHICLNDETISYIPWPIGPFPVPEWGTGSNWVHQEEEVMVVDDLVVGDSRDDDDDDDDDNAVMNVIRDSFENDQIKENNGFSEESVMEHLEIRSHIIKAEESDEICVVCQSEYEENEKLGRKKATTTAAVLIIGMVEEEEQEEEGPQGSQQNNNFTFGGNNGGCLQAY